MTDDWAVQAIALKEKYDIIDTSIDNKFDFIWGRIKHIQSAVTKKECCELFKTALGTYDLPGGCIVEIGSYLGRSTCALGYAVSGSKRSLFAIDHHMGDEHSGYLRNSNGSVATTLFVFKKNTREAGLTKTIRCVVSDSVAASKLWNKQIALLFVDGFHSYDACTADFKAYLPYFVKGSMIIFHDYTQEDYGIKQAVDEFIENGVVEKVSQADSLIVTRFRI